MRPMLNPDARKSGEQRKPPTARKRASLGASWEDQLAAAIRQAEKASGKAAREAQELAEWRRRKGRPTYHDNVGRADLP